MKIKRVLTWSALAILLVFFAWFEFAYWTSTNDCARSIPAGAERMKAIKYCEYGSPDDVLKLEDVAKPAPNDNQILVRVRAVSLRFFDSGMLEGGVGRLIFGLRKPKNTTPGSDFSGTVEAVGRNITEFKPGDEVFGVRAGALAEYICVTASRAVVSKRGNVTFEQAASIPTALTALQGLRDTGHVKAGQRVLINGATGGVGTFAVQIAKSFGAEVTGVCSTGKVELVRSIGADHVIDYTKEDFTKGDQRYDLIFDNVNNHSFSDRRRVLTPNGICVLAGIGGAGLHPGMLGRVVGILRADLLSRFVRQKFVRYGTKTDKEDLKLLSDLMQTGKVTPVIDRTYKLRETAEAMRYFEEGHARGKVVITVEQGEQGSLGL